MTKPGDGPGGNVNAASAEIEFDPDEIMELSQRYGQPSVRRITLEADEYLFRSRQHRSGGHRGEVVMAIERTAGTVLLHRKGWYERGVFRLPTGGIDPDEAIENTLYRELEEETGLRGGEVRFLGIIPCVLQHQSEELRFTSFIFHILHPRGHLRIPDSKEDISDIREVRIRDLPEVSANLRRIAPPRSGWGHWRAIAHDFVHEALLEEDVN